MERIVNLHIEKLPEGIYLATSDDIQGLIAQGRTIEETLELARGEAQPRSRSASPAIFMRWVKSPILSDLLPCTGIESRTMLPPLP